MARRGTTTIRACALVAMALAASSGVAAAADEFPAGGFAVKKLRFTQSTRANRDKITFPSSVRDDFFMLPPGVFDSLPGANVTIKINDYCRTYGPLVNKTGRSVTSKKKLQIKETNPTTGEKITLNYVESTPPLKFKIPTTISNTTHMFPSGTFPRRTPKAGDPAQLIATLVVGNLGGTFDVLTGMRLPFEDPGLQTASESLPDRDDTTLQDLWSFSGQAGQEVSFRVDTVGTAPSGLDLAAELIAPDGTTILKKADDEFPCTVPNGCGFNCPEVLNFVLPQTGTYFIAIHDFGSLNDGCSSGGDYTLTISEPACVAATLVDDDDQQLAVCGDDVVFPPEECEEDADCGLGEACNASCQCEVLCGNGTVDPGEECEEDADCPAETPFCAGCACTDQPPLGTRTITLEPSCSFLDTSLSPIHPTGNAPGGTIVLEAGSKDGNGVAQVTMDGVTFLGINIGLIQSTICTKLGPCSGQIYCDGNANADTLAVLDSLNPDLTCTPNGASCVNACEGFGNPHSGNPTVFTTDPGASPAGPPGSMTLTCTQSVATVSGLNANCAAAAYPTSGDLLYTTGAALSRVTQHCAGSGAGPNTSPEFGGSGQAFDCDNWTTTDGPGRLVVSVPAEEANNIFTGDGANLFSFCDAAAP